MTGEVKENLIPGIDRGRELRKGAIEATFIRIDHSRDIEADTIKNVRHRPRVVARLREIIDLLLPVYAHDKGKPILRHRRSRHDKQKGNNHRTHHDDTVHRIPRPAKTR